MSKTRSSTAKGQQKENAEKGDGSLGCDTYLVLVSKRFVVLSLLSCILVALAVGRTARMLLLVNNNEAIKAYNDQGNQQAAISSSPVAMKTLPDPKMKDGKVPPETLYTSKTFGTGNTASSQSRWIVTETGKENCVDLPDHQCPVPPSVDEDEDNTDDEIHLPAGQHLLMDIENVDASFLNSEERLAHAMLKLVSECGLTLLSYHCHAMVPMGVSCAGVLLESHVSFHTWPKQGVITLDLYTCGPNSLLPIVPLANLLFGVPNEVDEGEEFKAPTTRWAHKLRGFPEIEDNDSFVAEMSDMEYFPVSKMIDYKNEVATNSTDFQQVRIYDVLRPNEQTLEGYKKSLKNDESYESRHPELFEPDRIVFLDGVLQSRRSGEAAYHETLIHPAMFAHKNPKRVAIIGGGEGASLREVLKHKTVESVVMIEIDKMMVDVSRKYLPSWSDCSMLVGSAQSCFDDIRVEVQYIDAFQWFIDNFPSDSSPLVDTFDVIIMDALDPQIRKEFVNALYDEGPFLKSMPNALNTDGIFISQVGESTGTNDPPEIYTLDLNRSRLIKSLSRLGFSTIRSYIDNAHSGFGFPWQFIVAFRNSDVKADWFANPSLVDLKIRTRAMVTRDGGSPFKFFDGATMQSFYYPSKLTEIVYCLGHPESRDCKEGHGFDPNRQNIPISTIEVRQSSMGEKAGRGVFAKIDIPRDSYIGLEKHIPFVEGDAHTYGLILKTNKLNGGKWGSALASYINDYGEMSSQSGQDSFIIDSTMQSFTNHACDGSSNFGVKPGVSRERNFVYDPAADRQVKFYARATPLRDIHQGEELLDNDFAMPGNVCEEEGDLVGESILYTRM